MNRVPDHAAKLFQRLPLGVDAVAKSGRCETAIHLVLAHFEDNLAHRHSLNPLRSMLPHDHAGCPILATFLFLSLGWETTNPVSASSSATSPPRPSRSPASAPPATSAACSGPAHTAHRPEPRYGRGLSGSA